MTTHDPQECTCPLIDVSTWGGPPRFLRGDPRGSGCPIHETQDMRNERKAAEDLARYGERATGGPIEPGKAYRIGEDGPAPYIMPDRGNVIGTSFTFDNSEGLYDLADRLAGLKDGTLNVTGYFDADLAAYKASLRHEPVKVSIEIPASRWQAFKLKLRRIPGLGWLPVRKAWKTQFVGRIDPWPNGDGWTISTNPEETAP